MSIEKTMQFINAANRTATTPTAPATKPLDENEELNECSTPEELEEARFKRQKSAVKRRRAGVGINRTRSRKAKMAFKRNKSKILRARKKFAMSAKGKKLSKALSMFNRQNNSADLVLDKTTVIIPVLEGLFHWQELVLAETQDPELAYIISNDIARFTEGLSGNAVNPETGEFLNEAQVFTVRHYLAAIDEALGFDPTEDVSEGDND